VGGFGVGDGEGQFFVEGENFDAAGSGYGKGGMEEIEGVGVGGDVKVIEVAEEFSRAAAGEGGSEARALFSAFLIDWFEYLTGELVIIMVQARKWPGVDHLEY